MILRPEEISFLKNRTKLKEKTLLSLIDNERDFDLLLESISKQPITNTKLQKELSKFSLPFCIKYLFYKSNTETCDISTLSYIANAINEYVPEIQKNKTFRRIPNKMTEDNAKYSLIASGLFREELASVKLDFNDFINFAQKAFEKVEKYQMAKDIKKWSENLNKFNLENLKTE